MYIILLSSPLLCFMAGGRGAFVFIIAVTCYLTISFYRRKSHNGNILILMAVTIGIMIYLSTTINLSETAGMQRITGHLTDDESRVGLWTKAFDCFLDSPIWGWGVGSVWWKIGFRTHNFITDLMVEAGLLGVLLTIFVYYKGYLKLYYAFKMDNSYLFFILVFLGALVQCMFSGYWFGEFRIFMMMSIAFIINSRTLQRTKKVSK